MKKIIEVKDLNFAYDDGTKALIDINFDVLENETIALIGDNGSGKTSLALTLCGILNYKGQITINGLELNKKNINIIRSFIGMVFQNPDEQLFCNSVYEDIVFAPYNFGLDEETIKINVNKLVESFSIKNILQKLPHNLSLGQKKKIAICSVLSYQPNILIFDEPFSYLDNKHKKKMMEIIENIHTTKIIITHELRRVIDLVDRIFLMESGKLKIFNKEDFIQNSIYKDYEFS